MVGALPGPYMHHLIYTYKNDVRTYVTRSSSYVVLELSPAQLGVPCARTVRQPGGALSLCAPARPPESLPAILSMATTGHRHAGLFVARTHACTVPKAARQRRTYIHAYIFTGLMDGRPGQQSVGPCALTIVVRSPLGVWYGGDAVDHPRECNLPGRPAPSAVASYIATRTAALGWLATGNGEGARRAARPCTR